MVIEAQYVAIQAYIVYMDETGHSLKLALGAPLMPGYLCNNIGLVLACLPSGTTGVTGSPSCYMTQPSGIPILSPVLFMHVGDPYILNS